MTEKLVPKKLWREWSSLFVSGQPLYDPQPASAETSANQEPTPAEVLEAERQAVLNEGDFQEYKVTASPPAETVMSHFTALVLDSGSLKLFQDMMGEWAPPEDSEVTGPPAPNPIVGHVVNRLFNLVHPPSVGSQKLSLKHSVIRK